MNIPSTNIDKVFRYACENGRIEIAQQMVKIKSTIDISAGNEEAFRMSCLYGHLEVAKWLLGVKPTIDISAENDYAFRWACYQNYLNIAQWLVSLRPDKYKITLKNDGSIRYKIIKSLKILGTKEVSDKESCPICYTSDCEIISCCNHSFCIPCVSSWLNTSHSSCPTCRNDIDNTEFRKLILKN